MQISSLNVIFGRCTAETLVTLNVSNLYINKDETILQTKPFIAFLNRSSGIKRGQPHNAYNIIITDTKQRQPLCFFLCRCPTFSGASPYSYNEAIIIAQIYIYVKPIKLRTMEVLTIEHSAFQQLISRLEAMDEFIRKAKLEQQSSLDDDWVDGQAVCEYLYICDKTLQRLRSAGKITHSTIGNKYYYQIAEIKRCLRAHTIKSSEEMLQNLIAHKRNSKAKASANIQ